MTCAAQFDVYRAGTLLELVRDLATSLAQDGKRVKLCVQQSLGVGVFQVRACREAQCPRHRHLLDGQQRSGPACMQ